MKDLSVSMKQAELVSDIFKSFSHPTRLLILCRLSDGPATVQELQEACKLEQAITSQFLARLRAEGRVECERKGNQMIYHLTDPRLGSLMQTVAGLFCKTARS